MPRRLHNWTYEDVIAFLKKKGFSFHDDRKGSHEAWINKETSNIVDIDYHVGKSFPLRTLETMIRQSGMSKKEWVEWAGR